VYVPAAMTKPGAKLKAELIGPRQMVLARVLLNHKPGCQPFHLPVGLDTRDFSPGNTG